MAEHQILPLTIADFRTRAYNYAQPLSHEAKAFEEISALAQTENGKACAVLVPVINRQARPSVLFTWRTRHLSTHAGQIAFPGGKIDDTDKGPIATALREAHEEVGLSPDYVSVIGLLDPHRTPAGYHILPVLAEITPGFQLVRNEQEVEKIFELPLGLVMNPENFENRIMPAKTGAREYSVLPVKDYVIWGASAAILIKMRQRLYP